MAGSLEGKVALVTGGGSGIGRASAITFAREGARVIVADLDVSGGEDTSMIIRESGGEATFIKTDVSKAIEVETLINKSLEIYGRLDCAHNNAGIFGPANRIHSYPEEEWDHVINVNLKGVWLCLKYEILHMRHQGSGAIVNTSSTVGLTAGEGRSAYSASKHGVIGLTKTVAVEYAGRGIRVNAVCPGIIKTAMTAEIQANPTTEEQMISRFHPIRRLGTPEEVAEAVVWLCSDKASFITGHALGVDGGWLAQ